MLNICLRPSEGRFFIFVGYYSWISARIWKVSTICWSFVNDCHFEKLWIYRRFALNFMNTRTQLNVMASRSRPEVHRFTAAVCAIVFVFTIAVKFFQDNRNFFQGKNKVALGYFSGFPVRYRCWSDTISENWCKFIGVQATILHFVLQCLVKQASPLGD